MFIKVLQDVKETIFHCKRASISGEHAGKTPEVKTVFLTVDDGHRSEQHFEFEWGPPNEPATGALVNKTPTVGLEIIFMNDNGKTVDRKVYEY